MVTIRRGRESNRRLPPARNVFVNGSIMHLVAIRESLRMPARVIGKANHIFAEAGRGALEDLIRFVSSTNKDFVGLLQVPPNTS